MRRITSFLESAPRWHFALYSTCVSVAAYFCVFAFRKPFTVARFEGAADIPFLPAIDYKILLVIAQVLGYMLAKFLGIKFVSETAARHRAPRLVGGILVAELALLLFAVTPRPWNVIFIFMNGIPLGLLWGWVFGYVEGRRLTNLLAPALSLSFILGSGATKSAGSYVLAAGIGEFWMPFVTGLLFLPLFVVAVWFLDQLPPPNAEDERVCTQRKPMDGQERARFFLRFAPGLVFTVIAFMVLTAYRDFRDNFAREIWDALGYTQNPKIFALSELPIAIGVVIALSSIVLIKDGRKALIATYAIMLTGATLVGLSTLGYGLQVIGPATWMILVGLGAYLAFVPIATTLYDGLVRLTHFAGTATFMMQVADSCGYLSSIGLMMYKNFGQASLSWAMFLIRFSYAASILVATCLVVSLYYFLKRLDQQSDPHAVPQGLKQEAGAPTTILCIDGECR